MATRHVRWSQFLNGGWWEMTPGEDHDQSPRAALRAARAWAKPRGLWVEAELPAPREGDQVPWRLRFIPLEQRHGT